MRRLTFLVALLLVAVGGAPALASVAELPPLPPPGLLAAAPPEVSAGSWILYDATFETELGARLPDTRRAMASTTKMMTALVALERSQPDELVTVSEEAAAIGEAEIGLVPGEQWTMRQLLTALLVHSANDAAMVIAEHVGGTVEGFVKLMNEKADELGLANTRFANPHGLDAEDHFSSARDLLILALAGLEDDTFASLVRRREVALPPTADGAERPAIATNELLRIFPGAIGVKTGFTNEAGQVLVGAAEQDERRLLAVVMGSADHFSDAAALLEYGFSQFGLVQLIVAGDEYASLRTAGGVESYRATDSFDVFLDKERAAAVELEPSFEGQQPVLVAELEGEQLARVELSGTPVPPLPGLRQSIAWASRYWDWLWGNE